MATLARHHTTPGETAVAPTENLTTALWEHERQNPDHPILSYRERNAWMRHRHDLRHLLARAGALDRGGLRSRTGRVRRRGFAGGTRRGTGGVLGLAACVRDRLGRPGRDRGRRRRSGR